MFPPGIVLPSFTAANLAILQSAMANSAGASEIRFQDRTIRFQTVAQQQLLYTMMYNAVNPTPGINGGPIRQYRMRTGTGIRG
jgi:hypothetical protein